MRLIKHIQALAVDSKSALGAVTYLWGSSCISQYEDSRHRFNGSDPAVLCY
jgi:hypothetical protein